MARSTGYDLAQPYASVITAGLSVSGGPVLCRVVSLYHKLGVVVSVGEIKGAPSP